jgi:hypothetical protein
VREHAVDRLHDDDRDVQRDGDCEGAAVAFDGGVGVVVVASVAVRVVRVVRVAGFGGLGVVVIGVVVIGVVVIAVVVLALVVPTQVVAAAFMVVMLAAMSFMRIKPTKPALRRSTRFIIPVRPIGFRHHASWERLSAGSATCSSMAASIALI